MIPDCILQRAERSNRSVLLLYAEVIQIAGPGFNAVDLRIVYRIACVILYETR
jgi:hypothetical protein